MGRAWLVHYERSCRISAPFVLLLAVEHVNVLVAFVAVGGDFSTGPVTENGSPCTIRRFMQDVNIHARAKLLKHQGINIGRP